MQSKADLITPKDVSRIYVSGWSPSGTSMLLEVFRAHSDSFEIVGENNFFRWHSVIKTRFPNLDDNRMLSDFVQFCHLVSRHGYATIGQETSLRKIEYSDRADKEWQMDLVEACKADRRHMAVFVRVLDEYTLLNRKLPWACKIQPRCIRSLLSVDESSQLIGIVREPHAVLASQKRKDRKSKLRFNPALNAVRLRMALMSFLTFRTLYPRNVASQ